MQICYSDGGCLGNGNGQNAKAYGSYKIGKRPIVRLQYPNTQAQTVNEAEYLTLIATLEELDQMNEQGIIQIDSALMYGQLVGHDGKCWKVKALNLMPLVDKAKELIVKTKSRLLLVSRDILVEVLGH